jgi:hypothetical protein
MQQQYCWGFSELEVTIQCEAGPKWDFLPLSSTLLPLTKLQRFISEKKTSLEVDLSSHSVLYEMMQFGE